MGEESNKKTTADLIDHINEHEANETKRHAGLILIRALGIRNLLPDNAVNLTSRTILQSSRGPC